ncbi:MAG TPA: type II secretion system protein GspG, partial [Thermoanaerobaculia bacterium]|nr:type II secretion system protein GspG [Thermoanaerobaculia bacterium]
ATVVVVVVVLLLVLFIGAILAAIAIPNFLTAMQRAKQKRTMADLRSIAVAAEAYAVDHDAYPDVRSLDELEAALSPTYIRQLPKVDGWDNPIEYDCWSTVEGAPCDSYVLLSGGRDAELEGKPLDAYAGPTTHFDCDIVFSNGHFVQYPGRGEATPER